MSTLAWFLLSLLVWTAVSVAFGLLVGGVIRLRETHERPTRITAIEPEAMRRLALEIQRSMTRNTQAATRNLRKRPSDGGDR